MTGYLLAGLNDFWLQLSPIDVLIEMLHYERKIYSSQIELEGVEQEALDIISKPKIDELTAVLENLEAAFKSCSVDPELIQESSDEPDWVVV